VDREERRERIEQRAAVSEVLPEPDDGWLLRMASGEVLIYGQALDKRRPVALRAVVMPDGETQVFPTERFTRRRR
jgi:hypothetical protein